MSNPWKLDDAALALAGKADEVTTKVIAPKAADTDAQASFNRDGVGALREAGLLTLAVAKEMGGQGQGLRAACAVAERIARDCPSSAMTYIMHNSSAATVEAFGTEDQRKLFGSGGKFATLAFSESGSRSHFWVPVSTATPDGDSVKLDATKQLITSAGEADLYVWSSRPAAAEGLSSIWLVPSDTPGVTVAGQYAGLGLRGNSSAPLTAAGATIPAANRIGADGDGFNIMMSAVMPWFAFQNAAVSVGMMEGGLARAIGHVTQSKFSYDGSAIADLPQVRGHLARARVKLDMVRGLLLDGLDAIEGGREDATLRVLEAKVAASETSQEVLDACMRVCGGAAFRKDVAVERFFRDSRAATVMAPVADALYEFIGKAICGMEVF